MLNLQRSLRIYQLIKMMLLSLLLSIFATHSTIALAETASPPSFEDVENIRQEVTKMLQDHYAQHVENTRIEINVANLDNRLKLAKCEKTKKIKMNGSKKHNNNMSVRVSCKGQSPWSIFVPVKIETYQKVAVTTRDIFKDEVLTRSDITTQERSVGNIGFGFAKKIEPLIGNAVTRNIAAGSIIKLSQISEPIVVNRGDKITLESTTSGLTVAASAIAMSNGKVGDQIRVKNQHSKRVIEAFVTAPGKAVANL